MDNDTTPATTTNTFEMVFSMGLPAAGKSYTAAIEYHRHDVIDSDAIMAAHPAYNPNNPAALYPWAAEVSETLFDEALEVLDRDILIDGTGTDIDRMTRKMTAATDAGYSVTLMFVTCTLETSIARNASRDRHVPEHVIRDKADKVEAAFAAIRQHADTVRVIENN